MDPSFVGSLLFLLVLEELECGREVVEAVAALAHDAVHLVRQGAHRRRAGGLRGGVLR